jgi:uncharacterized protein
MGLSILDLLLPREVAFFDYMEEQSDVFCKACEEFKRMAEDMNGQGHDGIHRRVLNIKDYELRGDELERSIIDKLDTTFITPLDREDIHSIVVNVDRSIDILNDTAQKIEIYGIRKVPKNVAKYAEILVDISIEQRRLVSSLRDRKDMDIIIKKIHKLENDADYLYHTSIAELFGGKDAVEIIKMKEIYENLEGVVNSVDHVGQIVRGVSVKLG